LQVHLSPELEGRPFPNTEPSVSAGADEQIGVWDEADLAYELSMAQAIALDYM